MIPRSAIVMGGGMSGMAAAYALKRAGIQDVTLLEKEVTLGGLAGSFHRDGCSFPLGYHHILRRDRSLLYFLDVLGLLPRVSWRRIRMLFHLGNRNYDLSNPIDAWRFPLSVADKIRFAVLMMRTFPKSDWSDWESRSAEDLLDRWASPGVRHTLFEPLTQIKFELPCSSVSGAWLGARLHQREGSAALGYIAGANWTEVLCDAMQKQLVQMGVRVVLMAGVESLTVEGDRLRELRASGGERMGADVFVSTMPTPTLCALLPGDHAELSRVEYTALTSVVTATRQTLEPAFYWMNLLSGDHAASGLFLLDQLNPTLGHDGVSYINFVTHSRNRDRQFFRQSEDELLTRYRADFRAIFGFDLDAHWIMVNRIPMYSPVLYRGYANPPVRSTRVHNLYLAGNFRTYPSVVSTGTALESGLEAAQAILATAGARSDALTEAISYRPDLPRSHRPRHLESDGAR